MNLIIVYCKIKELKKHLLLEFPLNISPSHLHRVVKKIGFSLKKVKLEYKPNTWFLSKHSQYFYTALHKLNLTF